jgi:two-component system, oxyanion-binding sensor
MTRITAGFLPLLDASILIAASEKGFTEAQGIDLRLVRETSWANIRDRVSVGQFEVAQMLAPLPIAQNLGLSPLAVPMIAPFALGLGGNAITVSTAVWDETQSANSGHGGDAALAGQALRRVVTERKVKGKPVLSFAVVHSYSSHAYELRYWLAASGINPHTDVSFTIVPPGLMADALATGSIDGFCVGEPWNSVAVAMGAGQVLTTKAAIWRSSPEKVLGLTQKWAEQNSDVLDRLLLALHHSAVWCARPDNVDALARLLSQQHLLDVSADILAKGLRGQVGTEDARADFLEFYGSAANFPWRSHALWFYAQMARWQHVPLSDAAAKIAASTYRPDIYRRALGQLGVALPGASSKVEGALVEPTYLPAQGGSLWIGPDGFFDGALFDPEKLTSYVEGSPFYAAMHKI